MCVWFASQALLGSKRCTGNVATSGCTIFIFLSLQMFLHSTGKKSALRTDQGYIRQTSRPPVCGNPRSPQTGFFIYTSYQINFCCNHFQSSITGHLNDALDSHKRCFSNICSHLAPAFWIMVDHQQEVPHIRAWSRFPPAQREGFSFLFLSLLPIRGSDYGLAPWIEKKTMSKKQETRESQNFQKFSPQGVSWVQQLVPA